MNGHTSTTPLEPLNSNPDSFAAICKECGNGTLNNAVTNSFKRLVGYDEYEGMDYIICRVCYSTHIDVEVL